MEFIFIIAILILSIVIHELAHGYAALAQGDPTAKYAGRLTLNPIKHLDLVGSFIVPFVLYLLPANVILGWAKPVPYNPYNLKNQKWGESLVAIAGPASNILVAMFFGLVIRLGRGLISEEIIFLAGLIIIINIILALFNLIPIPPLDGSKILFDILPNSIKVSEARMFLERYGILIVFFVIILGGGFVFYLLSVFLSILFYVFTGDPNLLYEIVQRFFSG